MNHDRFWQAIDEALDARRDPLADAAVCHWAERNPEDALELGRLLARLNLLAAPSPRRGRRTPLLIVAGMALLLLPLALTPPEGALARSVAAAVPEPARVSALELRMIRHEPQRQITVVSARGRTTVREVTPSGVVRTRTTFTPSVLR